MNKLVEAIDSLDNYTIEDNMDEITIKRIDVFTSKRGENFYLENLPDKSLRLFYTYGTVIGFIYFKDISYRSIDNFFRNYEDDCEVNKIDSILVKYVNGDKTVVGVEWNSNIYELDNQHFIILFVGKDSL